MILAPGTQTNGTKKKQEVHSSTYRNMVYDKEGITNQWKEDGLLIKVRLLVIHIENIKFEP